MDLNINLYKFRDIKYIITYYKLNLYILTTIFELLDNLKLKPYLNNALIR